MLRTPASLSLESLRHLQTDHWAIVTSFALLMIVFGFAAYIGRRRLKMAKVWSKNLSDRGGRTENEILHAVGQMMFPVRMWMGAILILTFMSLPILKNFTVESIATAACFLMLTVLIMHLNREQKLLFEIRKIDPGKIKSNTLAVRTFLGVFLGLTFSFGVASLLTAVREAVFPINGDLGFIVHTLEFLGLLIAGQMLVAPLIVRIMLPSEKPKSDRELQTAKVVTAAFTKLGLRAPQVRILKLDGLRTYNALIAGANRAPGPFRQLVLISQSDELDLTENETKAIIHHELAHGVLLHIPVRLIASMVIWMMGLLPIIGLSAFVDRSIVGTFTPTVMAAFFLLIHPLILGRLVREQEIQADEFAVVRLGSSPHDLVSALSKATLASGALVDRKPAGSWMNASAAHPTVLEREALLQRLDLKQAVHVRSTPDLTRMRAIKCLMTDGIWRSTAALNIAMILIFTLNTLGKENPPSQTRAPASIEATLKAIERREPEKIHVIRSETLDHVSL